MAFSLIDGHPSNESFGSRSGRAARQISGNPTHPMCPDFVRICMMLGAYECSDRVAGLVSCTPWLLRLENTGARPFMGYRQTMAGVYPYCVASNRFVH